MHLMATTTQPLGLRKLKRWWAHRRLAKMQSTWNSGATRKGWMWYRHVGNGPPVSGKTTRTTRASDQLTATNPRRMTMWPHKGLDEDTDRSFLHDSPKLETARMSIREGADEQTGTSTQQWNGKNPLTPTPPRRGRRVHRSVHTQVRLPGDWSRNAWGRGRQQEVMRGAGRLTRTGIRVTEILHVGMGLDYRCPCLSKFSDTFT